MKLAIERKSVIHGFYQKRINKTFAIRGKEQQNSKVVTIEILEHRQRYRTYRWA